MAAPTRWESGPPPTTSTSSTGNSQISGWTHPFGPPKHFSSTDYLSPCKTSSIASTKTCSSDVAHQIPRPDAARRTVAAKTSRSKTKTPRLFPGTPQLALPALLGCPIAFPAPSSDSYIQAHDGAIDNGKTLETAGACPMSDRRRLEKTLIAPHPDHLEIARLCYMNPEPGLQAGLGVSCAAA